MNRRQFIVGTAAVAAFPGLAAAKPVKQAVAMHLKLGSCDKWTQPFAENGHYLGEETVVDEASLARRLAACRSSGINMVLLELGEGVRLRCNPGGALKGAKDASWLRGVLRKARADGLKVVPVVNFSTVHSGWMGELCRKVSTSEYFALAEAAIREVSEIFDRPNLIHIGMDDESWFGVQGMPMATRRRADVLWHAIRTLSGFVEATGARAWMWSDAASDDAEGFIKNVPKTVLQSPRFPTSSFLWARDKQQEEQTDGDRARLTSLAAAGFKVVPGCTTVKPHLAWAYPDELNLKENPAEVIGTVRGQVAETALKGFVCSPRVRPNAAGDALFAESCRIFQTAVA